MNERATDQPNEQALVKLYMELTGTTEATARSVWMYVEPAPEELSTEG
jgi:hypothetical protein